jgi:hypothetical protein
MGFKVDVWIKVLTKEHLRRMESPEIRFLKDDAECRMRAHEHITY